MYSIKIRTKELSRGFKNIFLSYLSLAKEDLRQFICLKMDQNRKRKSAPLLFHTYFLDRYFKLQKLFFISVKTVLSLMLCCLLKFTCLKGNIPCSYLGLLKASKNADCAIRKKGTPIFTYLSQSLLAGAVWRTRFSCKQPRGICQTCYIFCMGQAAYSLPNYKKGRLFISVRVDKLMLGAVFDCCVKIIQCQTCLQLKLTDRCEQSVIIKGKIVIIIFIIIFDL